MTTRSGYGYLPKKLFKLGVPLWALAVHGQWRREDRERAPPLSGGRSRQVRGREAGQLGDTCVDLRHPWGRH